MWSRSRWLDNGQGLTGDPNTELIRHGLNVTMTNMFKKTDSKNFTRELKLVFKREK